MAKNFLNPMRMESTFVDTKLHSVQTWDGTNLTPCFDGQIVVLDTFATEEVYDYSFKAASSGHPAIKDINTRYAKLPDADAAGVCVIDLAGVMTVSNAGNGAVYRMGVNTIGLTAEAGAPSRARKLVEDDFFATGEDNCTAALTVGEFAAVDATGKWKPVSTAPATGTYVEVIQKVTVSEGVSPNVVGYQLLVKRN